MKRHIQTFNNGVNQDISVNKYPNSNFYWAENFRVTSKDGLSVGALTNVKGTLPKLNFGGSGEVKPVGHCLIRDTLIMFMSTIDGGKIYRWDYNDSNIEESPTLIYHDPNLAFDTAKPIRAVGRYETPTVQKIYFTDGDTMFKHLNIIPEEGDSYPLTYDLDSLDLVPDVDFSTIDLALTPGGNLKAGKIQYAYQMYNKRGSESSISPESSMIDITNASDTSSTTLDYKGDEVGTIVNKSVEVSIDNIDTLFERIRIYALEYTVFDQVPAIRIVGEYEVDGSSISILDSGQSIGEFTLEEFRFIQHDFYPKSIDIKDNYLFAANIKENYFYISDDEFDARAFRFNSNVATLRDGNNIYQVTYSGGNLSTLPPITHEAYNRFNSVHSVYFDETSNVSIGDFDEEISLDKYNPATGNLGGYGPNISYEFTTTQVLLDEGVQSNSGYRGTYPSQVCEVTTRTNYSNPQLDVGYQRDEVYRFAIVFFDTKGRQSFAKWIGDIKFPNNTELPFIEYNNTNNKTYANILGINFTVNIPPEVKTKISGYQIVRVTRTTTDKTILGQGLVGYLANGGPDDSDNSDKYHMMSQASVPLIGDMYAESPNYGRESISWTASSGQDVSNVVRYTRHATNNLPIEDEGEVGFNPKYIEFTSPETAFNRLDFTESASFIEAFGVLNENDYTAITGQGDREERNQNQLVSDKFKDYAPGNANRRTRTFLSTNKVYSAKEFRGSSTDPNNDVTIDIQDDGKIFNNKCSNLVETGGDEYRRYGLRGVFNLCVVDADETDINSKKLPLAEFYNGDLIEVLIGNYKVDKGKSAYGGSTYEARSYNTYYPASQFIDKDTASVDVYGGDTYISFFSYARSLVGAADPEEGDTIEAYVFFPVETSINLELRLDPIQTYINWGWLPVDNVPNYKISETVEQGVLAYGTSYPEELGNLYRYNSAYSTIGKAKEYIAEPFDFKEEEIYDTRITASDVKINGEYLDSWTKFRFNNFIDVDTKHHGITKIITFKNQLYYFQPTAVGIAAVNQRSLVQDNQPGALSVGTGGILPRYDYVTDKSGSEFYEGIQASDTHLYYVDGRRKRINKLIAGQEIAVSLIKGIDSLLDKKDFDTVVGGFDRGFNEVIFTIDGQTLVFNETIDAFTGSQSYDPELMISIGKDLFSIGDYTSDTPWLYQDDDAERVGYIGNTDADPEWDYVLIGGASNGSTLFKHNVGDEGSFYGQEGVQDSYLTLIINPNGNVVNFFDNLDLRTESRDSGNNDVTDDVFYQLEASNDYQTLTRTLSFTSTPNLNTGSIKRIGRVWRTPVLPNQTQGAMFRRMLDTYIKVTLRYQNTGNTFRVHDVITYYRPSNH